MSDPYYKDMKRHKEEHAMYFAITEANNGIPKLCPCGGRIIEEIFESAKGHIQKYYRCKAFENDGLHIRKKWEIAIEEEVELLKHEVDRRATQLRGMSNQTQKDVVKLRTDVEELSHTVDHLIRRLEKFLGPTVLPNSTETNDI